MKILKLTDRFKLHIDDVTFELAPLSWSQKTECMNTIQEGGAMIEDRSQVVFKALKYSVKGVSGIEDYEGNEYKLRFDKDGNLEDSCIEELLNSAIQVKLIHSAYNLISGIQDKVFDPATGKVLKGVKIEFPESKQPVKS